MRIYDFHFAPNPRKLRVYLAEKGLSVPLVQVDITKGEQRTPGFLKKNPMGSLPVLELDDGTCLTESLAIIEYFEELHPEPPMIGTNPLERARVRELERLAEASIFNRIARVFFNRSPVFANTHQVPEAAEQALAGLPNALRVMDGAVGDRLFVAGERPTIADCTLFAAFEHAKLAEVTIEPSYGNLARWYSNFLERPSAKA
jgi:glutathione S-transferase